MEESPQTKEESNPLDNLENWLRSECGLSVHIFRGTCQPTDLPYLHVWNARPPKDLTYLPSFHLIFTLKTGSVFDLNLVTFNGKVIDTCEVDLDAIGDDGSSENLNLPSFVMSFTNDCLSLCKGLESINEDKFFFPPKFELLVDYLDERIVWRSKRCKFAVALDEGPVCANCKNAESELISHLKKPKSSCDPTTSSRVKMEPVEDNSDFESQEGLENEFSSHFLDESFFASVKIEESSVTDETNHSRTRRKRRKKCEEVEEEEDDGSNLLDIKLEQVDPAYCSEDGVEPAPKKRRTKRNCVLCHETFPNVENFKRHLNENPDCKKFVQEQNKRRKEEREKRKSKSDEKVSGVEVEVEPFQKKCPICLDVYSVEKNYLYDKELHEKILKDLDSPVDCPICSVTIDQRRNLNLHFDQEHTENTGNWSTDKAMCCECFSVMKRRSIKLHHRVKHEVKTTGKVFLCTVCGKQSSSKQIHELHLARKHALARDGISSPSSQVCDQCGRSYVSIDLLKQHISSMHRERKRIKCDECTKTFYSMSALVTHRVCIHLKIHPFKCRLCKYKAGDLSGVYRHYENSHGYRGKRDDVVVDQDDLRKIRDICQFNYFGNIG